MLLDGITEPAVTVELDTSLVGALVWDVSLFDGDDVFDGGSGVWSVLPASDVRSIGIRRGRSREDQAVQPGTLTVTLDDRSGDYDPDNELSPWRWQRSSLMSRGIGVRVRAGFKPAADIEAERLLRSAVLYLDSHDPGSTPTASVRNLGTGGIALNATLGSTAGADSNDPKWLEYAGTAYCYLPGVSGNYFSVPDAAALDIVGDIDIRVRVALDDWTPASTMRLVNKWQAAGQFSYALLLETNGRLTMQWSVDGTTGAGLRSGTSSTALTVTDGDALWVRCTLDVDNGAAGYDLKFWTSADGVAWTQLGTTTTVAGVTSIFSSTSTVEVGSGTNGSNAPAAGKFYRAQVLSGIAGTTVLDIDTSVLTSGAATSFTATTGQTVTINRATSGRKTAAVVDSIWLFGTDDYMEIPDNALLDFTASDSFSVLWCGREWATPASGGAMVAKRTTGQGWALTQTTTTHGATFTISDGTNTATATSPASISGALRVYTAVVDRTAQTVTVYCNGVAGTPVSCSSVGSLANSEAFRVGRLSGASTSYSDAEDIAVGVDDVALTATEVAKINTYFTTRAAIATELTTLYTGFIESVDADQGMNPTSVLTASDALSKLAAVQVPALETPNYDGDTTAERIDRILDEIHWPDALRDLTGSRTMLDTTFGQSALALADEAVGCEYGMLFASRTGAVTSLPFEDGFDAPVRFDLSDDPDANLMEYAALTTKPSTEYLVNDVTLNVGPEKVTAQDTYSIALRGTSSRAWTTPMDSLPQAQALAQLICDRLSMETTRADGIEIDCAGIQPAQWADVINAELRERLIVARTTVDGRKRSWNCLIESLNHDISPSEWTLRMHLSPGIGGSFAVWDSSLFDGDDRFYY